MNSPVDDELYDIVNLGNTDTGIDGIIRCSTKVSQYSCRITYFPNIKIKSESLTVSIPGYDILENTTSIDNLTKQIVVYFAMLNADILLKFWNEGVDMYLEDVKDEIWDNIKPITSSDLTQIKKLNII